MKFHDLKFRTPRGREIKMKESCELNFGVTFQLTEKVEVNGKNTHPLFAFQKDQYIKVVLPMVNLENEV